MYIIWQIDKLIEYIEDCYGDKCLTVILIDEEYKDVSKNTSKCLMRSNILPRQIKLTQIIVIITWKPELIQMMKKVEKYFNVVALIRFAYRDNNSYHSHE